MDENEHIDRHISPNDMRVLISVVQADSMGKAAQRLATAQPAISHALGVRLLDAISSSSLSQ